MTSSYRCRTPVAIFGFNRPDLVAQTLQAVREARPSRVFLVCDAPRPDNEEDARLVRETRAVFDTIDWPAEVSRVYAATNMGCRARLQTGLSAIFAEVPEAIILEDDCVAHQSFFEFCDTLLARHRDDASVIAIAGTNLGLPSSLWGDKSYVFSRYPLVWGWATWRRAWARYDGELRAWQDPAARSRVEQYIGNRSELRFWRKAFSSVLNGFDTWDYQLVLTAFTQGAVTAIPRQNLVANIGFRSDATHTTTSVSALSNLTVAPLSGQLIAPDSLAPCRTVDAEISSSYYRRGLLRGWKSVLDPKSRWSTG